MPAKALLKLSTLTVLVAAYVMATAVTTPALAHGFGGFHGGGHHGHGGYHGHHHGHHHHDHHHHDHHHHFHPVAALAVGIAIGTALNYRPSGCTTDVINGVTYCHDANNWYRVDGNKYIVVTSPTGSGTDTDGGKTVEQRLSELEDLAKEGYITEDEYAARRKSIIDGI
jgi:hypothetical protein